MTTQYQSSDGTLIMSDVLKDRLSYLQDISADDIFCNVEFSTGLSTFDIFGWDTFERRVSIEVPLSYLPRFFNHGKELWVAVFGQRYRIIDTKATIKNGIWTVSLFWEG